MVRKLVQVVYQDRTLWQFQLLQLVAYLSDIPNIDLSRLTCALALVQAQVMGCLYLGMLGLLSQPIQVSILVSNLHLLTLILPALKVRLCLSDYAF